MFYRKRFPINDDVAIYMGDDENYFVIGPCFALRTSLLRPPMGVVR